MRELQVRWMINGYGGYEEHRLTVRIPSRVTLILVLSLFVWGYVLFTLRMGAANV